MILGLSSPLVDKEKVTDFKGEVWSLNDWRRCYPWLPRVDRLYQLHCYKTTVIRPKWKESCEKSEMLIYDDKDFGHPKAVKIDCKRLRSHPVGMSSSLSIMLLEALEYKSSYVEVQGVMLNGNHAKFIEDTLATFEYLRGEGTVVYYSGEEAWRRKGIKYQCEDYIKLCREVK